MRKKPEITQISGVIQEPGGGFLLLIWEESTYSVLPSPFQMNIHPQPLEETSSDPNPVPDVARSLSPPQQAALPRHAHARSRSDQVSFEQKRQSRHRSVFLSGEPEPEPSAILASENDDVANEVLTDSDGDSRSRLIRRSLSPPARPVELMRPEPRTPGVGIGVCDDVLGLELDGLILDLDEGVGGAVEETKEKEEEEEGKKEDDEGTKEVEEEDIRKAAMEEVKEEKGKEMEEEGKKEGEEEEQEEKKEEHEVEQEEKKEVEQEEEKEERKEEQEERKEEQEERKVEDEDPKKDHISENTNTNVQPPDTTASPATPSEPSTGSPRSPSSWSAMTRPRSSSRLPPRSPSLRPRPLSSSNPEPLKPSEDSIHGFTIAPAETSEVWPPPVSAKSAATAATTQLTPSEPGETIIRAKSTQMGSDSDVKPPGSGTGESIPAAPRRKIRQKTTTPNSDK